VNSLKAFIFINSSIIRKGGIIMGKRILVLVLLPLLVLALAGVSQAWQGRMAGMGDPYGLVADPSDFLTHPAKLARGEGIKFYAHYRFTYTDVMSWDYNLDQLTPAGVLTAFYDYETSGQEYNHNALLGAATPLGPGRFGIFFTYDGMRGDYDGDEDTLPTPNFAEYDLMSDFDNFAFRLLYGLPVLGMDAGLELGMAYRDEMQNWWLNNTGMTFGIQNYIWTWGGPNVCLLPLMIPYDSQYWELLWKVGIEKALGPLGINASLRGGYIISSDNNYNYLNQSPIGFNLYNVDMDGDVAGWRIGSDVWVRVPAGSGLTLPFLFSIDYADKKRDGDGIGTGPADAGAPYDYEHKEQMFDIKVGGGIEKEFGGNTHVAAGIYYNYLQGSDDVSFSRSVIAPTTADNSEFPSHREHMVILRLAGEVELSPAVTLRMGLEPFYGWVQEDFKFTFTMGSSVYDIALDGYRWGIGGSLGGSVQFDSFTMEPFFNVGWQQFDVAGDGERTAGGAIVDLWDMDLSRSEWYIGGGISFLYDLP
jgi:hypothetical protein